MRNYFRSQLERRAPVLFSNIRAIRNRRYFRKKFSQLHADIREQLFPPPVPITVQCGPFRGLRYFDETVWGSITPKWLGSYEAELHPIVDAIAKRGYNTIIDVGCAEGYYAVGLALIVPNGTVMAFDTDFISRGQLRRLAALNQLTDRIQIGTFCAHSNLDSLSRGATLVVCDIEGFETQLLNPAIAVSLLRSDILVEVHETSRDSHAVESLLQSRFAASHRIERITAAGRDSWIDANQPHLSRPVARDLLRKATDEARVTGRVWLWMQASRA